MLDRAGLLAELQQDPAAIGYAEALQAFDAERLASMLNEVRMDQAIPLPSAPAALSVAFLVHTEFAALEDGVRSYINTLASAGVLIMHDAAAMSEANPTGATPALASLMAIFPDTTMSGQNLRRFIMRPASRIEALDGAGAVVTPMEIALAIQEPAEEVAE